MSLKEIKILEEYRSDETDLISDFYIPCLSHTTLYRRAVGYFTSSSIHLAMRGIVKFLQNNGQMKLIASPQFSPEDIEAINRGYSNKDDLMSERISQLIPNPEDKGIDLTQWECLSWMISTGQLEIKIALANKGQSLGMYHEKLGVFSDDKDNHIAFSGSANETGGGLVSNFETIDVFTSWRDSSRAQRKIDNFERLWENETNKVSVVEFPDACKRKILKLTPSKTPTLPQEQPCVLGALTKFAIPKDKPLRPYQDTARKNWVKARGRGILQMATGSGKTITGLSAAALIHESGNLNLILIICPYKHLVTQWDKECRTFGLSPILCYQSKNKWAPLLNSSLATIEEKNSVPVTIITTTNTFIKDYFQSRISFFPSKTLLLADEVHNMGAASIRKCLPENIPMRLGLSATPERWYDDEGTKELYDYFGNILEPIFTLKDALNCKALCQYNYYPILVSLNDSEAREYQILSKRIARFAGISGDIDDRGGVEKLLIQRARLIATAAGKEDELCKIISKNKNFKNVLFYCGDGSVERDDGDMIKHVDAVVRLLSQRYKARVAKFTSENTMEEREDLLNSFAREDLQGLVAIRCLDEGVDVPSTQTAIILASSTNPRQFIQRRGRILRNSPGKTHADIYDMVVHPPESENINEAERSLVKKELVRLSEFASLATNAPEAKKTIWKLQEHYHLTDI